MVRNLIEKRCYLNLTIVAMVVMAPFIAIIYYTMPATDEYVTAAFAQTYTFFESLKTLYELMNARYISNPIILACGVLTNNIFDLVVCNQGYILAAFIIFYFSIFYTMRSLGAGVMKTSQKFLGALIFLLLYILNMPAIANGFYWAPSAINYQLGHAFLLLFLTFLYQGCFAKTRTKTWIILSYVMGFLLFGANETIAITAWAFLFICCIFCFYKKLPQYRWLIFLFLFGLLCAIPAVLSPGSYQYIVGHDLKAPIIHRILILLVSVGYWFPQWIIKPSTLFATGLLIPIYYQLLERCPITFHMRHVYGALSIWLLLIVVCLTPQHLLLAFPYIRVWNVAYFVYLLGWFATIFILLGALQNKGKTLRLSKMVTHLLYMGLSLSLLFNGAFLTCVSDLLDAAPAFRKQMLNRYVSIYQQKKYRFQAVLPAFEKPPRTIFFADADVNPRNLANRYLSWYFGMQNFYVVPEEKLTKMDKINGIWLHPLVMNQSYDMSLSPAPQHHDDLKRG